MISLDVDQDGGNNLRVLVVDQVSDGLRIHPLETFDTACVALPKDPVEKGECLVVSESLDHHLSDVFVRSHA